MSSELKDLKVFSQEGTVIGDFKGETIAVYPPSLSRFRKITELIVETNSDIFEIREKLIKSKEGNFSKEELQKLENDAHKILQAQIDKIAPLIVAMTCKPDEHYNWNEILTIEMVEQGLSAQACLDIIDAYIKLSAVPDVLKKITALS